MRPLRYSINITLDGCCDHRAIPANEDLHLLHRHHAANLEQAVRQLKQESGKGLFVGGVKLAMALTELGLIDEYELVVHPRLVGHGPTLFAGLSNPVDLKLVDRREIGSGTVAMRYEPRR